MVGLSEAELLEIVRERVGETPIEPDPEEFTAADVHFRLRNDNVVVRLRPRNTESDGGIHLARPRKVPCTKCVRKGDGKCRLCGGSMLMKNPHLEPLVEADVLAVGPGYFTESGAFVELEVKPGDVVLVSDDAGDKYRYRQDVRLVRAGDCWEEGVYKPGEIAAVVEGL